MSTYKPVLVTAPYFAPVAERFQERFRAVGFELQVLPVLERAEEEDLIPRIGEVYGVISGDDRFTARVIAAATKLKVIAKWGTGIDSIDQEACKRYGIAIRRTVDAFSHPVADSVLGYALAFCRNLVPMDRAMKEDVWKKIHGRSLRELTFGVVGVGHCGKQVGHRVVAFGSTLLGTDIVPIDEEFITRTRMRSCGLDELLRASDIVSLNCDLNPTSHHLVNADTLRLMKPTAVLINAARGPIVHESALVAALQEGRLGGAALDVFEDEPLPAASPLRTMDNVFLAPHNANSSPLAWENVHESTVRQILEELTRDA